MLTGGGRVRFIFIFAALIFSANIFSGTSHYGWRQMGSGSSNGTNGSVFAIIQFNGKIIAAGKFTNAGGISVNNIAGWDPNTSVWSALGSGLNDTVYSLYVYNSQLFAAGNFTQSGVTSLSKIARWNGTVWQSVGSGLNGDGYAMVQFGTDLIVGGSFSNAGGSSANNIAKWNGSIWSALGSGISGNNGKVYSLAVYSSNLIAAGKFSTAGGNSTDNIAKWNGSNWSALAQGIDGNVYALTVYNGNLIAGGDFEHAGSIDAFNIAKWNGSSWSNVSQSNTFEDNTVNALTVFSGDLIAGGSFRKAGSLYVDRISRFDGSSWNRMQTGMSGKVKSLYVYNSDLYAGGDFATAGGRYSSRLARWINEQLVTVSGQVKYSDNNSNVLSGTVKIFRLDVNTREVIVVDSAIIGNGTYSLTNVPRDSSHIVVGFPDDELDFVPSIYPSTIDWRNAGFVNTYTNRVNININVFRITQQTFSPLSVTMGGSVFLNINPVFNTSPRDYPYLSDAIVYIKQGNLFRRFAVSKTDESYLSGTLNSGTYDVFVSRIGYITASRTVPLIVSQDTINFYLDSLNIIGLHNITTTVPKDFSLAQNYPNPFNPVTNISFSIAQSGTVKLAVFDINGIEIALLVNGHLNAGTYNYDWNASQLASGVYFYRIELDPSLRSGFSFSPTKKMILIK